MPINILVADDDSTLRTELASLLETAGHEVRTARDGREALAVLKDEPIDLAFVDLAMPGETGLEVLREAKAIRPKTAFILMTGYATLDTAVDALRSGASDFVKKPFEVEAIERVVEAIRGQVQARSADAPGRHRARRDSTPSEVKMAFLHYRTGLLICSKTLPGERTADHDLIVATLDVIRNFMETSFPAFRRKRLRSIRMGDYTLVIEGGHHTYLTVVVKGEDREEFRTHLRAIVRDFEARNAAVLEHWDGELGGLRGADLLLETLLAERSWVPI